MGDFLVTTTGRDLKVGQHLWVDTAERAYLIESIRDAPWPGTRLVTLDTGSSNWTVPVDLDEQCAIEVLS